LLTIGIRLALLRHATNAQIDVQRLLESESGDHSLVLDLNEAKLVDRDAITFLGACEAKGVKLTNCPAFIREWIEKEATGNKGR